MVLFQLNKLKISGFTGTRRSQSVLSSPGILMEDRKWLEYGFMASGGYYVEAKVSFMVVADN